MKIYSFDGKKRIIDNFDEDPSPLHLGRRFVTRSEDTEMPTPEENETVDEKQIEN